MWKKGKVKAVNVLNLLKWIATRKAVETKHRSEHSVELIYFAREILENVNDKKYWSDEFYEDDNYEKIEEGFKKRAKRNV